MADVDGDPDGELSGRQVRAKDSRRRHLHQCDQSRRREDAWKVVNGFDADGAREVGRADRETRRRGRAGGRIVRHAIGRHGPIRSAIATTKSNAAQSGGNHEATRVGTARG